MMWEHGRDAPRNRNRGTSYGDACATPEEDTTGLLGWTWKQGVDIYATARFTIVKRVVKLLGRLHFTALRADSGEKPNAGRHARDWESQPTADGLPAAEGELRVARAHAAMLVRDAPLGGRVEADKREVGVGSG